MTLSSGAKQGTGQPPHAIASRMFVGSREAPTGHRTQLSPEGWRGAGGLLRSMHVTVGTEQGVGYDYGWHMQTWVEVKVRWG
jgi:hypothetical protein